MDDRISMHMGIFTRSDLRRPKHRHCTPCDLGKLISTESQRITADAKKIKTKHTPEKKYFLKRKKEEEEEEERPQTIAFAF